ncbi:MAG: hypothetical protein K2Q18_10190, partial [Bdellovibrionales bacterium]|nr:hypothetical protein [Bdellovibrionales bacterium]
RRKKFQKNLKLYQGLEADHIIHEEMITSLSPNDLVQYGIKELNVTQFESDLDLASHVADLILDNKIVGWYQGRGEIGPRALGNRSILCNPGNIEIAEKLSKTVKERAAFRPYALSILKEDASEILEESPRIIEHAKWMQFVVNVKPQYIKSLRAGLHVDNTTRSHICAEEENPLYHLLLSEIKKRIGIGAVLNTSFNASGYPMVGGESYALSMFIKTKMDYLVLGKKVIKKSYG